MTERNIISSFDKINSFDFNLLFIFEAIFVYNSVTIAASNLGSSPSSVSQALSKLRTYFSDPLFVRKGQGLVPTTVAINLHAKISRNLGSLADNVVNYAETEMTNQFVIYSSPYTAQRVMPAMCAVINRHKLPYELIHIAADATLNGGEDILTFRKADIIFDTEPYYGHTAVTVKYMQENVVAVCNADHPRLGSRLTSEAGMNEQFTRINLNTLGMIRAQHAIEKYFNHRRFAFSSNAPEVNAAVTEQTESISFVTEWFYEKFKDCYNLKKLECDFEIPPITLYMTYNRSSLTHPGFVTFINLIKNEILADIGLSHQVNPDNTTE